MHQDVTEAMNKNVINRFFPPGETLSWDLYDLLLIEHPGVASKVHLFGYKVVLNWWFELSLEAEYRVPDGPLPSQTSLFHVKFSWKASKPDLEKVDLSIVPISI